MSTANAFISKKSVNMAPAKRTAVKKKNSAELASESVATEGFVSVEQRFKMICEAAYYIAEKNGFAPESELSSWLEAEKQIDAQIMN